MKAKLIYGIAALILVFASANGASRGAKSSIHMEYVPQPDGNGDYMLYIFASDRLLVCEEQKIRIVEQGDALHPVVLECSHHGGKQ